MLKQCITGGAKQNLPIIVKLERMSVKYDASYFISMLANVQLSKKENVPIAKTMRMSTY